MEPRKDDPYGVQNWEVIGKSPKIFTPLNDKRLPQNDHFVKLEEKHKELFNFAKTYDRVMVNFKRYKKSLLKGDVKPVKPCNAEFELAKQFAETMLSFLEGSVPGDKFKVNLTTASGPFCKLMGKLKKRDVMDDPEFLFKHMMEWYNVLFSAEAKDEVLSNYDIRVREKLRTFFANDTIGLIWQKYFYSMQNELLKINHKQNWIKYGFVKQFGGFNDLMHDFADCDVKFCADVSGWDRFFPLLMEVCELRRKNLEDLLPQEIERLDWLEDQLVNHFIVTKDGWIFRKNVGNPSGSNNTTEDNCIGHLMIMFYFLIRLFQHYHQRVPTYEEVVELAEAALYGDDNLVGLKSSYFNTTAEDLGETLEWLYPEVYAEFGMPVKFLEIEIGFGPPKCITEGGKLEFLGSRPVKTGLGILPKPNCQHLASSLTSSLKCDTLESSVSKIRAAVDLTQVLKDVDEECDVVFNFCVDAAKTLLHEELTPSDRSFCLLLKNGLYDPIGLATGLESGI